MPQQPTTLPRWADNPPVAPPTTVVAPSEPEKDVGFQPGTQAQIVNITFAGDADGTYNVPINGVAHSHASTAQSLTQLITSIAGLINGGSQAAFVTAANIAGTTLRVTSDQPGRAFTYDAVSSGGASAMTATLATPNRSGKPIRQFLNWLFNTGYLCIAWLFQSVFKFSDFGPDQALPQGDLPSTGAGLGPVAAADFSARAFADGFGVGPVDSPQHTYADDADTYWDLGPDGVWDAVEVSTGDPAPAISADHVRVYMLATVAGARTAVTDFRNTHILFTTPLDLQMARFGDNRRATLGQRGEARRVVRFADGGGAGYTLMDEWIDDDDVAPAIAVRLYMRHATRRPCFVRGAKWNGDTSLWDRDGGTVLQTERYELGGSATASRLIVTPAATFADSVWDTVPSASGTTLRQALFEGSVGGGIGNNANNWPRLMVPSFLMSDPAANARNLGLAGGHDRRYLLGSGGSPLGVAAHFGYDEATNAYYDPDTDLWTRITTGQHSYMLQQASTGFRILRRDSGAADTWNDTINLTTGWTQIALIADEVTINGELNVNDGAIDLVNAPITSDSNIATTGDVAADNITASDAVIAPIVRALAMMPATPLPNTVYGPQIVKASGHISVVTGALITDALESNYTAAFNGDDIDITMTTPLASPPVAPVALISDDASAGVGTVHLGTVLAVGGTAFNTIRVEGWNATRTVHVDMSNVAHTSAFYFAILGNQ